MSILSEKVADKNTEKNFEFFKEVDKVFEECSVLRKSRMGYNVVSTPKDYLFHGPEDFLYEIFKKVKRADNLLLGSVQKAEIEDSLMDIINYAAYTIVCYRLPK